MSIGDIQSTERGSGARFNTGKPDMSLVPIRCLALQANAATDPLSPVTAALFGLADWQERHPDGVGALVRAARMLDADGRAWAECAHVFDYGRKKYAAWNWAKGMPWSVPLACAVRHLWAMHLGEATDPESGLPHRGHVLCNVAMLMTYTRTYPDGDDRALAGML